MCRAAASESRAASAAQTHESMPPLNNTTERGFSPAKINPLMYGYLIFRWPYRRNSCPLYFLIIAKLHCLCWVAAHSNSLGGGFPDEFMYLQTQANVEPVGQNPLRQNPRIKLAIRRVALRAWVLQKHRGK